MLLQGVLPHGAPPVSSLLCPCCPAKVPRLVPPAIVDAVKRMSRGGARADVKIVEMPEDDDLAPLTLRCEVA